MPLSKAKQAEWMREYRKKLKQASVGPKTDALQSKSRGIKTFLNRTASPPFQPKVPDWVVKPNRYLLAHLRVCPDYDPVRPGDHFKNCPYVNPLMRSVGPNLPNCPDERFR